MRGFLLANMHTHSDLEKAHKELETAYEERKQAIGRVDNNKLYDLQSIIHNALSKFLSIETYLIADQRSIDAPSTKAKRKYIIKKRLTLFDKAKPHDKANKQFNIQNKKGTP